MLLSACGTKKDNDGKTDQDQGQAIPAGVDITLIENAVANCQIVLPKDASGVERTMANSVREKLRSVDKNADAKIVSASKHDEKKVEILIGNTGYPESEAIYKTLGYGTYCVRVVGHKLVIAAYFEDLYSKAIADLATIIRKTASDKTLILEGETNKTIIAIPNINAIPVYSGGKIAYTQEAGTFPTGHADQITLTETTAKHFETFKKDLASAGYKTVQENTIGKNEFITVSNGKKLITAYFMGYTKETRIIVENDRDFVHPTSEYTAICDTTLWQLGLDEKNPDIKDAQNAYVIQLADGRFVIHDTGVATAAKYVYNYMKSKTPEGQKIKVAAVFISHPHSDHMDGLIEMAKLYKDEIEVEALYYNFGARTTQSIYAEATVVNRWNDVKNAGEALGAKAYVTRTGQKIEIADAVFEILWNPEDFGARLIDDYNNASIVVRMTVGGKKVIFLGDHRDKASPITVSMYKDDLKCDMITVAHHGFGGSVWELYNYAQPSIVFWPNTYYDNRAVNNKIRAMASVKNHYLAGDGDVVVTLVDR